MDWRPLSAHGGQVTDVKFDSDGRIIVRSRQNVDAILDANRDDRNHGASGWKGGALGHKVASIPLSIAYKWLVEDGVNVLDGDNPEYLARKLNDPDWAYLRTGGGHIGVTNGVAR